MQNRPNKNALVLIGRGSRGPDAIAAFQQLTEALAARINTPVQPCYLESGSPALMEGLQAVVEQYDPQRVLVLPFFLGGDAALISKLPATMTEAQARWLKVDFHYGPPVGARAGIVAALSELAQAALQTDVSSAASETALLVVGRGSADAESNSEIYKMARLLWEKAAASNQPYTVAEAAFFNETTPDIVTGIKRCIQSGARRVVVIAYLLMDGTIQDAIRDQVQALQADYPDHRFLVGSVLETQPGVIDSIAQHYWTEMAEMAATACDMCPFTGFEDDPVLRLFSHSHGPGSAFDHTFNPDQDLQRLLPPRYQGDVQISAAPMAGTDLLFDSSGQVSWDQMWGGFCELAMAGGPPHRGDLLEPVAPEVVTADLEGYGRVLSELERGITLITRLPIVKSKSPGWVGVRCTDEDMALWLLRAIIVENVSVRREKAVLYLPAGPNFRLEHEIKNVITVIAKTHHYWTEHIAALTKTR